MLSLFGLFLLLVLFFWSRPSWDEFGLGDSRTSGDVPPPTAGYRRVAVTPGTESPAVATPAPGGSPTQTAPSRTWTPPVLNQGIRVRVLDPEGRPVSGARVRLWGVHLNNVVWNPVGKKWHLLWPTIARTNELGTVEFTTRSYRADEIGISVKVHADGFAAAQERFPSIDEGQFREVTITLEHAWVLQGRILGLSPQAIGDAHVTCWPFLVSDPERQSEWNWEYEAGGRTHSYSVTRLVLDADGGFRCPFTPRSGVKLEYDDEFSRYESEEIVVPLDSPPIVIRARKKPRGARGQVEISFPTLQARTYVVSFRSLLTPVNPSRIEERTSLSSWSVRDESYPFPDPPEVEPDKDRNTVRRWMVPVGTYEVTIRGHSPGGEGSATIPSRNEVASFTVKVEEDQNYSFTPDLKEGAVVRGRVIDAVTDEPLLGAQVALTDSAATNDARSIRVGTDEFGAFTLVALPAGDWEFKIEAKGYEPKIERLKAAEPGQESVVIRLKKAP